MNVELALARVTRALSEAEWKNLQDQYQQLVDTHKLGDPIPREAYVLHDLCCVRNARQDETSTSNA